MDNKNCYTYLIGWSSLNVWYYGRQTAINCNPNNLWVKYFTSSKHVKQFRIKHGEPDVIQIRKTFGNNVAKCCNHESTVLRRLNAKYNPKFLNKTNGTPLFDATGHKSAICQISGMNLGLISLSDPRWKTGEIVTENFGKKRSSKLAKTCDGLIIGMIDILDPRWKTGEIVHFNKNNSAHFNTNTAPAIDSITKISLGRVSLDDPRWKTGEIISSFKNQLTVRDVDGKVQRIDRNDPKYINGEYTIACVGSHRTTEQKQYMSSVHRSMRNTNRVCCIHTRKEYTIQNFMKYVLSRSLVLAEVT